MKHDFTELRLDGVTRRFAGAGGHAFAALNELTLTIRRGEFIALLGPSGCGKSTALNCIAGSDATVRRQHLARRTAHRHAAAGEARLRHGVPELRAVSAHERGEERRLRPAHARRQRRGCRRAGRARAEARAADRTGAQAARTAFRRPAAARRDRPRDRDRAAADPDGRAAVESRREAALETRAEIRRIHRELGRATIYVTHDQDEALVAGRSHRRDEGRRRAADRDRRRKSTRNPRTCTSRASWVIATCSSSTSSARRAIASCSRAGHGA